jgi:hypothetical protein
MADQAGQQEISIKEASFPSCDHSRPTTRGVHIKKGITSFNTSTRKNQHSKAWPRCLVDQANHSSADAMLLAALVPHLHQPQATTIHRGPPASLSHASRQHIIARGQLDASSLDSSPAVRRSQHRWGEPSSSHKTKHGILATALGDCTTT